MSSPPGTRAHSPPQQAPPALVVLHDPVSPIASTEGTACAPGGHPPTSAPTHRSPPASRAPALHRLHYYTSIMHASVSGHPALHPCPSLPTCAGFVHASSKGPGASGRASKQGTGPSPVSLPSDALGWVQHWHTSTAPAPAPPSATGHELFTGTAAIAPAGGAHLTTTVWQWLRRVGVAVTCWGDAPHRRTAASTA